MPAVDSVEGDEALPGRVPQQPDEYREQDSRVKLEADRVGDIGRHAARRED